MISFRKMKVQSWARVHLVPPNRSEEVTPRNLKWDASRKSFEKYLSIFLFFKFFECCYWKKTYTHSWLYNSGVLSLKAPNRIQFYAFSLSTHSKFIFFHLQCWCDLHFFLNVGTLTPLGCLLRFISPHPFIFSHCFKSRFQIQVSLSSHVFRPILLQSRFLDSFLLCQVADFLWIHSPDFSHSTHTGSSNCCISTWTKLIPYASEIRLCARCHCILLFAYIQSLFSTHKDTAYSCTYFASSKYCNH